MCEGELARAPVPPQIAIDANSCDSYLSHRLARKSKLVVIEDQPYSESSMTDSLHGTTVDISTTPSHGNQVNHPVRAGHRNGVPQRASRRI